MKRNRNYKYETLGKIPMPKQRRQGDKYPWATMEIGECFVVRNCQMNQLGSTRHFAQRRTGRKFAFRQKDKDVYVWRVS